MYPQEVQDIYLEDDVSQEILQIEIRELKSKEKEIQLMKEEHKNLCYKHGKDIKLLKATKDDKEKQLKY